MCTAAHPGYDVLDVRREEYLAVRRHINRLRSRFYKERNLIPDEAFAAQRARQGLTLALCCGPFVDDMHHVPPFRTILKQGFKGVRDEVAAALAKCPKNDPLGQKELETALLLLRHRHDGRGAARNRLLPRARGRHICPLPLL